MASLTFLAPLACAAPMGLMFWMMTRDRKSSAPQGGSAEAAQPGAEEQLASLRSEVARLRDQARVNTEHGAGSGGR